MKKIDYDRIIPNTVAPKLAHHGFKYDESQSYPPQGQYSFTRNYWCKSQCLSIGPVEYDLESIEAVISQKDDSPTEVDQSLLLIQEPGFRLWLSNKYLLAVLQSEYKVLDLLPNQGAVWGTDAADVEDLVKRLRETPPPKAGEKLPTWWEFHGADDLRRVLSEIVEFTVTDGLEWFERQVIDIRRYHEQLDRRRKAARKNSFEESATGEKPNE